MARKRKAKPLTATQLRERLRARYQPPEWVMLDEVQPGVGYATSERRTDMVGLSTYPSRGLRLVGFELKSARSDVLKELKDPEKALAMQQYCDLWYLVAGRSDLVGKDELPPKWGLIVPHGTGLRTVVNAPKLEPKDWPRELVCMLTRKAYGNSIADAERQKIHQEARAKAMGSVDYYIKRAEKIEARVDAFARESGVDINRWSSEQRFAEQGKLLKIIMRQGLDGYERRARSLATQLEKVGKQLREALGEDS